MKKILALLLVVFSLVLVGCQDDKTNDKTQGGNQQTPAVTVDSVSLKMQDGTELPTEVFDGSTVRLAAEVKGSEAGLKVVWETSDASLAKVTNGVVKFGQVKEDTQVTVSAVSKDDNTKKASHTFTIKHCVLNLADSKGNIDDSLFMEEGAVTVENGDVGLIFSDVNHTKFYVEATIQIDSQDENDAYPKFGIMVGNDSMAGWNTDATVPVKNAFFFCDTQLAAQSSGWTGFNFVAQLSDFSNWDWGRQIGGFNVSNENKWNMGEGYTIGLLRDGVNYYLFAKDGDGLKCYKHVVYTDFAADEACYAWIGGWKTGVTVSNIKALVGDDADAMYLEAGALTIANTEPLLYLGTTHQINVEADVLNFDLSKVTYTSDNEAIATVDANGLVTASETPGTANITIKWGDLTKTVVVTVTDDLKVRVVLDGKMEDALWTEQVKANKFEFDNGDKVAIDIYGSRNSLGLYLYVDYQTTADYSSAPEWWQANNFELRVYNQHKKLTMPDGNAQWWVSTFQGGKANMTDYYVSAPKLNEETGKYEIVFEVFLSYEDLGASKTDLFGFGMGSNDGGPEGNGWYNTNEGFLGYGWEGYDFAKCLKIHEDGIGVYYPESFCGENHEYGDFVVEKQASCAADGEQAKYCKWCNHRFVEVIAKGEHSYDAAKMVTELAATCMTEGAGHIECNGGCGTVKNVVIPRDLYNHVNCEKEDLGVTATVEKLDTGGWADPATWTNLADDLSGDFEVTVNIYYQSRSDINGGAGWRTLMPIVYHDTGDSIGSVWVTRMDWCGWCDDWGAGTLSPQLNAHWGGVGDGTNHNAGWFDVNGQRVDNGKVSQLENEGVNAVWTCTRTGSKIRNSFVITAKDGSVYTYFYQVQDVNVDKHIGIALESEFARYEVLSVIKHK